MNGNGNKHRDHKNKLADKRNIVVNNRKKYAEMERGKRDPRVEEIFRRPAYGKIGERKV